MNRRWVEYGPPNYPFILNQESPQAQGLVAWWPMLGNQGFNRLINWSKFDISDLDLINGPVNWTADNKAKFGRVLTLSYASTQYAKTNQVIFGIPPFTLSAWFRITNKTADGDAQNFIAVGDESSTAFYRICYFETGSGIGPGVSASVRDSGSSWAVTSDITQDQWHLCVGVFAALNSRTVYLDNIDSATNSTNRNPTGLDNTTVGALVISSTYGPLEGDLADVRVYNRALSISEVYQLYAPQTRWELYQPIQRDSLAFVAAAGLSPVYPGRNHPSRNVLLRL